MADNIGFEPMVDFSTLSFQDSGLNQLSQLSITYKMVDYLGISN